MSTKVTFQNGNGLNDMTKLQCLLNRYKVKQTDLICISDTRFNWNNRRKILAQEEWEVYFSGKRKAARGMAVHINPRGNIHLTSI